MLELGILIVVIQLLCAIHAGKTGRGFTWIFVILCFPLIGCLVYFFIELLPELQHGRAVRTDTTVVDNETEDPTEGLRRHTDALEKTDNVENRMRLAEECLSTGLIQDAVNLYESTAVGFFRDDPTVLMGLARAYFANDQFEEARETLDHLIEVNPEYRSETGHLLYARSLESIGDTERALNEYDSLVQYSRDPEAICRYAILLRATGDNAKARELLVRLLDYARHSPQYYRKRHKDWIQLAQREIAVLCGP